MYMICLYTMSDKFVEERPHFRGSAVHTFRVPLDAHGKRVGAKLDCFDCSVGRPGAYSDIPSGKIDCLMVEAVYMKA